jgi:predicted Zn-ribbon and HTH transcriptional regulator
MMEETKAPPVKEWANCPKCGWHYKQAKLETCPMCRYAWRLGKPGYQQPPYEPPTLAP